MALHDQIAPAGRMTRDTAVESHAVAASVRTRVLQTQPIGQASGLACDVVSEHCRNDGRDRVESTLTLTSAKANPGTRFAGSVSMTRSASGHWHRVKKASSSTGPEARRVLGCVLACRQNYRRRRTLAAPIHLDSRRRRGPRRRRRGFMTTPRRGARWWCGRPSDGLHCPHRRCHLPRSRVAGSWRGRRPHVSLGASSRSPRAVSKIWKTPVPAGMILVARGARW
jgi:hypothetical protein